METDKLEILKALSEGLTQEEVAEKLGISQGWVSKIKQEAEQEFTRLTQEGISADRIAAQYGLPVPFIHKLLKRKFPLIEKINEEEMSRESRSSEDMIEEENKESEEKKDESVSAKMLRVILKQAKIPRETLEAIMDIYNEEPELYEDYPQQLWSVLTGLDVKPNKANLIISRFMNMIHGPQSYPYPYPAPRMNVEQNPQQYPSQFPTFQPYQYPPYQYQPNIQRIKIDEKNDDEEARKKDRQREREELREMILDLKMAEALRGAVGGISPGYGPLGQTNPFVAITTEPILDAQGNPVYDRYGMPLYRIHQQPIITQSPQQTPQNTPQTQEPLIKLIETMQGQVGSLSDKVLEVTRQTSEKEINELKQQVAALASRDPIGEFLERIDNLKNAGLIPTNTSEDFQRWKFEQEKDMQKWMAEREDKWRELQLSRLQMDQVTQGIKDVVSNIGGPLAKAVAEGYIAEKQQPKSPQQSTQSAQIDLSALPDDELQMRWNQIQTAKSTIQQYESKFLEELKKRKQVSSPSSNVEAEISNEKMKEAGLSGGISVDTGGDR